LKQLGEFDPGTRANFPTAVAFKKAYFVFNPGSAPIEVKFSNRKAITAAPGISVEVR
jgi:hypothetical protein